MILTDLSTVKVTLRSAEKVERIGRCLVESFRRRLTEAIVHFEEWMPQQ